MFSFLFPLNVALRVIRGAVRARLQRWVIHCILKAFQFQNLTRWLIHCAGKCPLELTPWVIHCVGMPSLDVTWWAIRRVGTLSVETIRLANQLNRDTAHLLSAVGDPVASGSGDLAGALLLTIGALMCRRSRQDLYSTVHSIPFPCTQASQRVVEVALRDLSETGGTNSAGHSPEKAWAPDFFVAGWDYPRCTDYWAGKVPNGVPDVAYCYEDGLTSLKLLSQEQEVKSFFCTFCSSSGTQYSSRIHQWDHNTKFSAWMTRAGMPIAVEAYACNQVAHFPRTWGVKTPRPSVSHGILRLCGFIPQNGQ